MLDLIGRCISSYKVDHRSIFCIAEVGGDSSQKRVSVPMATGDQVREGQAVSSVLMTTLTVVT